MNTELAFVPPTDGHMTVIPTSVIDIAARKDKRLRSVGGHDNKSSRAEPSAFPEETARLCFELFLRDATTIFDPFAGWGERGYYAAQYGMPYRGYDINPAAILYARETYGVCNTLANSAVDDLPAFDGLVTCPPYWNLERYSPEGIDGLRTWADFLAEYRRIFVRAYAAACYGTTFCIQVGDWRKGGAYYNLTHKTRVLFEELGATIVDDVVISRKAISKIKIMLPQAKRLGYTVKTHESLLVFRK